MTPDLSLLVLLGTGIVAGLCLLSAKAGHILGKAGQPISLDSAEPTPTCPQVVVNVPADYRPIEPLVVDGQPALVGSRALLFITIYKTALAAFSNDGSCSVTEDEEVAAYEAAKMGVKCVYGETFDA